MDRTERFRGRLMAGDQVLMEGVQGQLKSHVRSGGTGEWTGFFEIGPETRELVASRIVEGNRYRLVLIDGRSGHVHIHIKHDGMLERTLAEFHGTGSVRR
jgi:hypothetical protein